MPLALGVFFIEKLFADDDAMLVRLLDLVQHHYAGIVDQMDPCVVNLKLVLDNQCLNILRNYEAVYRRELILTQHEYVSLFLIRNIFILM